MAQFYSYTDEEQWHATRHCGVPWTELQGQDFILTVPTELACSIPSVPDAVALLSDLFASVHTIIGVPAVPHRAVVDVGLLHPGIELGYPTFVERKWAEAALNASAPTPELLQFLASVALHSFPDDFFFPALRGVLALLAAMHALAKRWRSVPALRLAHLEAFDVWCHLSSLIGMLGADAFASCLQKARARTQQGGATNRDLVEIFYQALGQRAKRSLDASVLQEMLATETNPWSALDVIHGPG
jgi:hypothetical protein